MVLRPFNPTPQDVSRAVVGVVGASKPQCRCKPKQHDAVNKTRLTLRHDNATKND
jgi:hypothetical protein